MTGNMVGRVFNNRYKITERLGIGGMAEVYRAQDNVLGRLVAVKVMLPQYAADPSFAQRFRQEAAAAANLQSPYIVNIYDWGQDEGTYYIVMELIHGSDLKTAIKQRGAINQRKVAEIGSQVCQALSVAHGLDIIHRDIKPQNIMVQPDGNTKVMDFGIARAKNSVKTQTSSVLGTAHYISPEQAQGKNLTAASDIYSLGIVLYEAATGTLPFDGPDAVSVAMKQVNDEPTPPREINPNLDPSLEAIVMKAMAKNPADRFETAKEMRAALNDYLAGRPVNLGDGFTRAQTAVMGGVMPAAGCTAVMPSVNARDKDADDLSSRTYSANNSSAKKKMNPKKKLGIAVGIIAAIAVIAGVAWALLGPREMAEVPDVIGMSVEEATVDIEEAGFRVGVEEVFNDKADAGTVTDQDPEGNTEYPKGSVVTLSVSKGTQEIEVPDLTNMTADEARKELTANGLKCSAGKPVYSDDVEKDRVAKQDVKAGTKVAKGTTVTYHLSLGSEGIEVPNVIGQSEGAATTTLNNAGFYVDVDYQESDDVEKGLVISQNPSSGKLQEGKHINIVVSSGKGEPSSFTVSASANGGGQVSPGSMTVKEGGSVTFTVTPNSGCQVVSVTDTNGNSYNVGANGGTFTVSDVSNDVAVTVTFRSA